MPPVAWYPANVSHPPLRRAQVSSSAWAKKGSAWKPSAPGSDRNSRTRWSQSPSSSRSPACAAGRSMAERSSSSDMAGTVNCPARSSPASRGSRRNAPK